MYFIKNRVTDILGFDVFGINYTEIISSYEDIPILFGFSKKDMVVPPNDVMEVYGGYYGEKRIFEIDSSHSEERPKEFTFEGLRFVSTKSKLGRR